jgi:tetratricopeptide (TPR) repeat protein
LRVKLLKTAFLAMAALAVCAAPSLAQQPSQTPQPQQGDSSQPTAPNQGSPQDGPLPPPPAPDKPAAQQRPANNDGPQWSSSKRADDDDSTDDSTSGSKSDSSGDSNKAKPRPRKNGSQYSDDTSDPSDASDSGPRPPSKAKPGQLPPESDSAWDPFHAAQDVDVGKFYMDKGDYDAAITRFEDAIRLQGNFAKPRALIAEAYEKKGDKEQAAHYYQEYLKVLPNAADAKKIQKKIAQLQSK